MPDKLTPQQRHANMAAIKAKDTKPEWIVRRFLFSHGFRYRLQVKYLPGRPDIVMRRLGVCIFINGCFWHGHGLAIDEEVEKRVSGSSVRSSACCRIPKTNTEFWANKILTNRKRDDRVQKELEALGWRVMTIWECELKPSRREATLQQLLMLLRRIEAPVLLKELHRTASYANSYSDDELMMAAEDEEEYSSYNK